MSPDHRALVPVPASQGYNLKRIDMLMYAIRKGAHTELTFHHNEQYLTSFSLDFLEEKIKSPAFIRIHDRHLINLYYVNKFDSKNGRIIQMKDKRELEVSIERLEAILELIGKSL